MIQCSRCKNMVDERVHRACPQCAAPLPLSPSPNAPGLGTPPASVRTNARVSLTGEILEDVPAAKSPANSPYAAPLLGAQMPTLSPRSAPSAYDRRETEPDNSGKKALLINLTVVLVLLGVCGGGGYWKWMHRTEPKAQVTRYVHAIQWLDWGVVWDLSASRPGNKSRHDFISMMNDKFDNNGLLNIVARRDMEKIPFEIGEPTITGNEATVPVTRGAYKLDAAKSFQFNLTNFGGVWKIHPLAANPLELMHDPISEKAFDGKLPSITPGPGGIPTFQ